MNLENIIGTGTKERIFNCALELFADRGYESVSIRDIANGVKIRPASVYNHFESKQEILDALYEFFYVNRLLKRLTPKEYMPIIKTGTRSELANVLNYPYPDPIRMFNILRIVFARIYFDEKAQKIYIKCILEEGFDYAVGFLEKCKEFGRIHEKVRIERLAHMCLSVRLYVAMQAFLGVKQQEFRMMEFDLFEEIELMFLDPPA